MQRYDDVTIAVRDKDVDMLECDLLMMSDEVKSRFNAISVAVKLLREPHSYGMMYIQSEYLIGVEPKEHSIKLGLPFVYKIVNINSPIFVWSTWVGDDYVQMYIECDVDLTVKYPVKCYTIDQNVSPASVVFGELDENSMIEFLDRVLYSL